MKEAVEQLMPRISPGLGFEVFDLGSKSQFMNKLPGRLKGYEYFLASEPGRAVVLLRDVDQEDCRAVLGELHGWVRAANLSLASAATRTRGQVMCRLADEMLESWFFGDGAALHAAFPRISAHWTQERGLRRPDDIRDPARRLEDQLKRRGYYPAGMPKAEVARLVASHMAIDANQSPSFVCFRDGVRFLAATTTQEDGHAEAH
ncbi:hypothetical protein GCM10027030_01550 [Luteococcus sediminum]